MAGKERAGDNQKLKMLYLLKIFSEETDDLHPLTMPEIISKLAAYGVNANRKTLYLDFEELRNFGVDIISNKVGHDCYYNIGSRDFELPELKLLVDSVQSSKFITDRKSTELIKKLESLVSKYEGKQLQRQVVISGRVKAMNESIYYNVDKLHEAIGAGCQIRFKYYQWNVDKEMELRKNGDWYQVSPWALMWDDEYYYLVAFDAGDGKIKHYRVDKMLSISVTKEKRLGQEQFKRFDMPRYTKSLFGMYGGEQVKVMLEARNDMVGVIIDRFGKDILIAPVDSERFRVNVDVSMSNQFLGWIMAVGDGVKIVGPDKVVEKMRAEVRRLAEQYGV
ncbi:MAG: WYL domain-containing protein [Clostridiales bacterium]|nr:WYL domain-containing protein [Clostridiales bacterium]